MIPRVVSFIFDIIYMYMLFSINCSSYCVQNFSFSITDIVDIIFCRNKVFLMHQHSHNFPRLYKVYKWNISDR